MQSDSIKRLCFLLLVSVILFTIATHLSNNPQHHWLVLTGLLFSLISLGNTFAERLAIVFFSGFIASIIVLAEGFGAVSISLIAVYLFLITIICVYLIQRYANYFLPIFIVNLLAVLASASFLPLALDADRSLYILAGTIIAGLCQFIFAYRYVRNALRQKLQRAISSLASMNDEIFACFSTEYGDNVYLYERRIHVQKNKFMQVMRKLRNASSVYDQEKLQALIKKLEDMFDIIIDCGQLRHRVSDSTIFDVCRDELERLAKEIKLNLINILQKDPDHLSSQRKFIDEIKRFEEVYLNVLQITAKEPLVFLLFISSLKALQEALESLRDKVCSIFTT